MAESVKNLSQISNMPKGTINRFFPVSASVGAPLRRHGIEMAGISHNVPGYFIRRQAPGFHQVSFTLKGCGYFEVNGKRLPVPEGHFYIARAGVPHTYGIQGKVYDTFWVHLMDTPPWKGIGSPGNVKPVFKYGSPLYSAMEGYLREAESPLASARQAALMYAELIRVYLERELLPPDKPRTFEREAKFDALWEKVRQTPAFPWDLLKLARELNMSPVNFLRLCKKTTGDSPVKTLRRIRMFCAQELLAKSGSSVESVAEQVGYGDAFAFSKAFHRFSGFSPAAYRGTRTVTV
jgi:AraC-like DNA-binding protein